MKRRHSRKKALKISIVIPARNEEKNIKEAIAQFTKYKKRYNLEVIVSDGISTDNTVAIAKKYADLVVKYKGGLKHTIAEGRNRGASKAKGDLLIFVDADIRVPDPSKLFDKALEMYGRKDVAAGTMDMYIYPEEENILDRILFFIGNMIVRLSILVKKHIIKGECQVVKKEFFDKVKGYNAHLVAAEDSDLYQRISKYGKIVILKGFKIYDSPRRFRQEGYLKAIWGYFINNLSVLFRKKAVAKEWKPVR